MINRPTYKQVLDSGGTLKEPNTIFQCSSNSITEYMKKFPYSIQIKIGETYTQDFKEFNEWCNRNLGIKYKDWFLFGHGGLGNSRYTLYLKDSKKSLFLALKYSEVIDIHQL